MINRYFISPLVVMISNCFLLCFFVFMETNTKKIRTLRKKRKINLFFRITGLDLFFFRVKMSCIIKGMVILLVIGLLILIFIIDGGIIYLLFDSIFLIKWMHMIARVYSFFFLVMCFVYSLSGLFKKKKQNHD